MPTTQNIQRTSEGAKNTRLAGEKTPSAMENLLFSYLQESWLYVNDACELLLRGETSKAPQSYVLHEDVHKL